MKRIRKAVWEKKRDRILLTAAAVLPFIPGHMPLEIQAWAASQFPGAPSWILVLVSFGVVGARAYMRMRQLSKDGGQ